MYLTKEAYLFDSEAVMLKDKVVAQCKSVVVNFDGEDQLCTHLVLVDNCVEDINVVIDRLYKACVESLPSDEVPHRFKIRENMPVHTNGKRNDDALKKETEGYITR